MIPAVVAAASPFAKRKSHLDGQVHDSCLHGKVHTKSKNRSGRLEDAAQKPVAHAAKGQGPPVQPCHDAPLK